MDYKAEYDKLLKKLVDAGGGYAFGTYKFTPNTIPKDRIKIYKNQYVKTKQYNEKTQKYEDFDSRTGTFYNEKEALSHIKVTGDKDIKKYYLDTFGTETPEQDIKYLEQGMNLQKYENRKNLSIDRSSSWWHGIRHLGSKKIEGSDQKVFDAEHDQRIAEREKKLAKLRINTSYGKKDKEEKKTNFDMESYKKEGNEFIDLFINKPNKVNDLKINQNEANLDLTLTNGTK